MLKCLRWKLIGIIMALVTALLVAIFLLLLHFTVRDLESQSLHALQVLGRTPNHAIGPKEAERVRVPHFVLELGADGELLVEGDSFVNRMDEGLLQQLLETGLNSKEEYGNLEEYELRYLRANTPRGAKVVFVDISGERETIHHLIRTYILVGAAALVAFWLVSMLLARWAVKPVELAWQREKQFIADASHELKTPLAVILTNTELLQRPCTEAQREQYTENIQTVSRQMRELTQNLLELARLDNGGSDCGFDNLEFSQLVENATLPFEAVFFEQALEFTARVEKEIHVRGNELQLRQVVEILLDNAQKYALPHSDVELWLEKSRCGHCLLRVQSQGDTLSKEQLSRIFDRFYRCDAARTSDESYGLGLSIAQSIVTEHRGKIWARSKNGVNTFYVQLPTI